MPYSTQLADRIREYLSRFEYLQIVEKKMFQGLAFIVNDKMCINVSGDNLMCRFDPNLQHDVENKKGYEAMVMRGKALAGYCYVTPEGFKNKKDFEYWMSLCLDFNERAKSSKKAKK